MDNQKIQPYFISILLVGVLVLAFIVLRPFLGVLAVASICAVVFYPIYNRILHSTNNRRSFAALCTTLLVVGVILIPIVFLGTQIFSEAQTLYSSLISNENEGSALIFFNEIIRAVYETISRLGFDYSSVDLNRYLSSVIGWIAQNVGSIFSNSVKIFIGFFIFVVAIYSLFKDGHRLKGAIVSLSPLADSDDEAIFEKLRSAINAVVKGNLIVAVIQGLLATVGFSVFGVPHAILWGAVAATSALIPGIGTSLVLVPAIIYVFITGSAISATGLLIWGFLAVGLVDNLLAPKLIGGGMRLHPLIVFLSVIGGLMYFGPIGFVLGPLTISLLFSLIDIYSSLFKRSATIAPYGPGT